MRLLVPASLLTAALLAASAASPLAAQSADEALYRRMGGYDVIAALVDDFFDRFGRDETLAPFLGGLNAAAGARVRQNFIDFFCSQTGGPCLYNGRDMKATHTGLPIRDAHFEAVMRHFSDAMDAQRIGPGEKQEILAMLRDLRSDIVQG